MTDVLVLLAVLAVPTIAWTVVRRRPRRDEKPKAQPTDGTRHRWWQP